jgi:hypothetical protein
LQASSYEWDKEENDYSYFVKYYLGIILSAYREFEERTSYLKTKKKPIERIQDVFLSSYGEVTKKDILEKCPDISVNMIEYHLKELLEQPDIDGALVGGASLLEDSYKAMIAALD